VAADRADDADIPPREPPDGEPSDGEPSDGEPSNGPGALDAPGALDGAEDSSAGAIPGRAAPAETRSRDEYYLSLREKVASGQRSAAAEEQARAENWTETAELSRRMWTEYRRRWPPGDRTDSTRSLDRADDDRVDAECDRVAEREREKISPALRDVADQDPGRHLIGFEHRLKGRDRIKEKVCVNINEFDFSPEGAVSLVPDAIRYTFQYQEARYSQGVRADLARLQNQGFDLVKLKNSWSDEQYKGINSQWVDSANGQRFELQFHTRISFEAKQLTHGAYERIRTQQADEFEEMVLEAFQKKVTAEVPVPPGAAGIPDYPERGADAR
jgi:hypothetical protein